MSKNTIKNPQEGQKKNRVFFYILVGYFILTYFVFLHQIHSYGRSHWFKSSTAYQENQGVAIYIAAFFLRLLGIVFFALPFPPVLSILQIFKFQDAAAKYNQRLRVGFLQLFLQIQKQATEALLAKWDGTKSP